MEDTRRVTEAEHNSTDLLDDPVVAFSEGIAEPGLDCNGDWF